MNEENMKYYNAGREVPAEAKKKITGGRINGFTDINPMWRIQKLTEMFGACGLGWKTQNVKCWTEPGADVEVIAFCSIELLYRDEEYDWSAPIFGVGSSKLIYVDTKGIHSNDEAFKMAHTDALSGCCKMLGIGASVYWEKGETKYNNQSITTNLETEHKNNALKCAECGKDIKSCKTADGIKTAKEIANIGMQNFGENLCGSCLTKKIKEQTEGNKDAESSNLNREAC